MTFCLLQGNRMPISRYSSRSLRSDLYRIASNFFSDIRILPYRSSLPRGLKISRGCEISQVVRLIQFGPFSFNPNHIIPPISYMQFFLLPSQDVDSFVKMPSGHPATPHPMNRGNPMSPLSPAKRTPKRAVPPQRQSTCGPRYIPHSPCCCNLTCPPSRERPLMFLNVALPRYIPTYLTAFALVLYLLLLQSKLTSSLLK